MTKIVKPAPGRKVRRPDQGYKPLPAEGMPVEWSPYYERALIEGDIEIVEPEVEEAPEPAAPADSPPDAPSTPKKGGKS